MKYTLKPIICAIFFIMGSQFAHAEDLIDCKFINVDGSENFDVQFELKDGSFYALSNQEDAPEETYEDKLIFHATTEEKIKTDKIMRSFATDPDSTIFHPKVTFVELLGSGGVNTTTINVVTKDVWHSRHSILLSQYIGKCETDIF